MDYGRDDQTIKEWNPDLEWTNGKSNEEEKEGGGDGSYPIDSHQLSSTQKRLGQECFRFALP